MILQKGWRCLDCTVCEGCGKKHDEANMILCDECDTSYHTYCTQPPLETVPTGAWKCKYVCGTYKYLWDGGEEGRGCDTSYHTYCTQPAQETVPTGSWKCKYV